jgi:hypothetical protein
MEKTKMLTTQEVAARLDRPYPTIALWVRQGRFKNAVAEDAPRGKVWWIPESDLEDFIEPTLGRPPKPKEKQLMLAKGLKSDNLQSKETAKKSRKPRKSSKRKGKAK